MHHITTEQRYQLFVNHAIEYAMIIMDAEGTIVEWSSGAEKLLGWTAQEAIGQPAAIIFTQEDRQSGASRAELDTALTLGRAADVRWHIRKDGTTVFCDGLVSRIFDEDDKTLLGFGKIMREAYATRKEQADQQNNAASEQRSFLAAVLESVENGIVACDKQGRLTFFNEAARKIHGQEQIPLSFEKWAGRYQLYRADGTTLLPVEEIPLYRALNGELVEHAQVVVLTADGHRRNVQVTGRPLRDGNGQILGAIISMHDITERYEAKDARDETIREQGKRMAAEASNDRLFKAEEQLRLATEAAQLGIWTWDVRNDIVTWENERMHEIFNVPAGRQGLSAAQLMGEYLHSDDVENFRSATDKTIRTGGRFNYIGRFHRLPDRGIHWLELTGVLQSDKDQSGNSIIIGTAADVTERKKNEEALNEARIRLEATLSAAEVASWIWDIQNDRIIADRNLTRLFGVPEELAAGAPLARYIGSIHPEDMENVSRQIQQAIDSKEPYFATYRVTDFEHAYRWVNARGRIEFDEHGQPAILAGVTLDITREKEMQDAWRITEERYRTLITSMDQAFGFVQVLLDAQGKPVDYRFEEVNHALEVQSGLVNAAGRTIREMVPNIEPHWIEIYGRVALTREPARFIEHSAAMGYWWDVYATPIGEPHEHRIAILFSDVTAKKQAEETLHQLAADLSEANRRKTEFLATLAHELRNPLAPVRTGLDLMRMTGKAGQGSGKVLEMMDRQLNQMVHLIEDLMDVSRINSGKIVLKKDCIDLQGVVANAIDAVLPAIESAHHQLDVHLPEQAVLVDADPTRLAQILSNLLTNAAKYTPSGGRIELTAKQEGDSILIEVTDTGIGIPVEEQGEVFEMFSQVSANMGRSQGGLGIGLSLVRSLVEMHGGSIAVNSPGTGQGATFTVRLPLPAGCARGQNPDENAGTREEASEHQDLHVVIADDNVDAAGMLSSLLQAAGHATETIYDGLEAVQKIIEVKPDLAILDIGMPGLDGYEVAERIRDTPGTEGVVLVALTGWGGDQDRDRSRQAGFDAHLTKPAGLSSIHQIITDIIKKKLPRKR